MKNQSLLKRIGFACAGIAVVWRRERSFRTQMLWTLAVAVLLIVVRPGLLWSALAMLACALVLALEMINAALEYLMDHVHPDIAREIGAAKDAASGAVFVITLGAFLVGILMLIARFQSVFS